MQVSGEQVTPSQSTSMQANDCAQRSLHHSTEPSVSTQANEPMSSAQTEPNNIATTKCTSQLDKPINPKKEGQITI